MVGQRGEAADALRNSPNGTPGSTGGAGHNRESGFDATVPSSWILDHRSPQTSCASAPGHPGRERWHRIRVAAASSGATRVYHCLGTGTAARSLFFEPVEVPRGTAVGSAARRKHRRRLFRPMSFALAQALKCRLQAERRRACSLSPSSVAPTRLVKSSFSSDERLLGTSSTFARAHASRVSSSARSSSPSISATRAFPWSWSHPKAEDDRQSRVSPDIWACPDGNSEPSTSRSGQEMIVRSLDP